MLFCLSSLVFGYAEENDAGRGCHDKDKWRRWQRYRFSIGRYRIEMAINSRRSRSSESSRWDEQILDRREGMKNGRREKMKAGRVIKEARGQEGSLRRLDSEMSRGEKMDTMKRKRRRHRQHRKIQIMLFDTSSSHAWYCSYFMKSAAALSLVLVSH